MKKAYILIVALIISISAFSQSPTFAWAKAMGGSSNDRGFSIAVDGSGNVFTAGIFNLVADFNPGVGVFNLTSNGGIDIFVSKLDPSGNFLWAKQIGGIGTDISNYGLAIDVSNNVYFEGYFTGTVDFDPGAGVFNMTSVSASEAFICKLDPFGNFIWAKQLGATNAENIALDNSGNVYATGYFTGTADFDPSAGTFNMTSSGVQDVFVTKLDISGNFVWAKKLGGVNIDEGTSVAIDPSGNVLIAGTFETIGDFDPGVAVFNLTSSGLNDLFITKLDALGNLVWAKRVGGTGNETNYSIKVDLAGNVGLTGSFRSTVDFDPNAGVFNMTSAGTFDNCYILKLNAAGNFIFSKQIGESTGSTVGTTIFFDVVGSIFISGYYPAVVDFDPGAGVFNLTPLGPYDCFVVKLDNSGNFSWATSIGGTGNDSPFGLTLDASNNIYTTGNFANTADFDAGVGTFTLTSAGSNDAYVTKYAGCPIPVQPGSISGLNLMCAGAGSTNYSVASVAGATSYTWSLPVGWSGSSATNTISATPGSSGVFSITATNACGTSSASVLGVTVNALPTILAATNNTLLCTGQSATLTASGASTFTFNPGGAGASIVVSPTVTANYTITGTNAQGCNNLAVFTQSVSACTGIDQISKFGSEISIYPSPTKDMVIIVGLAGNEMIEIYNLIGQKININVNSKIDFSDQPTGIYFIRITDGSSCLTKKIIKE